MSGPSFPGVRVVGGLLPADLLSRLVTGRDVSGLAPGDYHLAGGESVREAANRAWSYLTGAWTSFRGGLEQLQSSDRATSLTRERWLLLLLRELGFGRVPTSPAGGMATDGKAFAVSHLWEHVPMHLLGWRVELDRRTPGVPGAAEASPQSLLQELLNRSDESLWAVLSNGRVLRLLRDSTSLVGPAYVEFDLEAIFDGELFSDFLLLFTLLHQSRFEVLEPGGTPADCWLERWRGEALESGTRALNLLRDGVVNALQTLGTGFLQHPSNGKLREDLASGRLSLQDFHHGLLRTVYRLLFLFVAEDLGVLLDPHADTEARRRYDEYFSTVRLRRVARRRRGGRHADLWQALIIVTDGLGRVGGRPELALPGIGGLFEPFGGDPGGEASDLLGALELPNHALLSAIRDLSIIRDKQGGPWRPIDYRNLGAEELGSIYESLLEFIPRHDPGQSTFQLVVLAGNDRKETGSYYTPTGLTEALLDATLDPLLDDAVKSGDPVSALLALTVCDPACGSGHFLVAAARRIAKRLAFVETGDPEPPPEAVRAAMRRIVANSIYGVDVNPLAAELARVSLWIETQSAGQPLVFLDAHIKVGNALLGTTPALLADGIPDEAYKPLEGDDRKVCRSLLDRNRKQRKRQGELFGDAEIRVENSTFAEEASAALRGDVRRLEDVHVQAKRYRALQQRPDLIHARRAADAWCAAFFAAKDDAARGIPTTGHLTALQEGTADDQLAAEVDALAAEHRFFHWHLEFPDVFQVDAGSGVASPGWRGGFSCLLGNPPWERVKLHDQEFFASREPAIAAVKNAAARKQLIAALPESQPRLWEEFRRALRSVAAESNFMRGSGRFPLGGVGEVNTYAVFADLFRQSIASRGRAGVIVPNGLVVGFTYRNFLAYLLQTRTLAAFFGFENEDKLFADVHNQTKFGLLALTGTEAPVERAVFTGYLRQPDEVHDTHKRYMLTAEDIARINPNTLNVPAFRWAGDAEVTAAIHTAAPVLINHGPPVANPWSVSFLRMFDMTSDAALFLDHAEVAPRIAEIRGALAVLDDGSQVYPLYEGKMIWQYDHRYGTYEGQTDRQANKGVLPHVEDGPHDDPQFRVQPRYWVDAKYVTERVKWAERRWAIGFRDVGPAERSFVPALAPAVAAGNKLPLLFVARPARDVAALYSVLASLVCDYSARQRGVQMNFFVVEQIAVLSPEQLQQWQEWLGSDAVSWLVPRVLELVYTNIEMQPLAQDLGDNRPPFRWIPNRRAELQAEVDAAVMHLYGLNREQAEWLLDSFTVLRKYEQRDHGEFRTRRLVLRYFDDMAAARATGTTYRTHISPEPSAGDRHEAAHA